MTGKILKKGLLVLGLVAVMASPVFAQPVALWGSTTCQKRFLEPGADALEKATGVSIKVFGVGTGKGMLALFEGKTNVAISSNTLEESIKSAQKVLKAEGKPEIAVPENLKFHLITEDVIVPIVNVANPVNELSWAQLADLNTGKVANWKEVGGSDVPVQVVTSHSGSSTRAVFQSKVMKKADYAASALKVKSTRLEINEVSNNPGGIGAVSHGFYNLNPGNTKIVKTAEIKRPLALVTIGDPSPEVQKIIDFFRSPEGQKQIVD